MANEFVVRKEVTDRYARALFDVATESGHHEALHRDIETLKSFIDEKTGYWAHVTSPVVSKEDQQSVMKEIADGLHLCQITLNLLDVLCANERLSYFLDIAQSYLAHYERSQGVMRATIEVASPLDAKEIKSLADAIGQKLGKELSVKQVVNPDIMGGAILKMGSVMVDASLSSRLYKLQQTMKG